MSRPTQATISLAALAHNLSQVDKLVANSQSMAVIKANGYGHGVVQVATGLKAAKGFAVACIEEACELREAGFKQKILLLEGVFNASELDLATQYKFDLVVHASHQIQQLNVRSGVQSAQFNVWMKIDTGMHRLGFAPEHVEKEILNLQQCASVSKDMILMTHFANADNRADEMTDRQIASFQTLTKKYSLPLSLANSAGILAHPKAHAQWVRPGIMLYGVSPFADSVAADHNLKPVMQLESEITAIKHYKKGDRIGYGGRYQCPADMKVGVIPLGYGDGYPRHARDGTPILVNQKRASLVGCVSMDMIMVDLNTIEDSTIGSVVQLWGESLPIEEVAKHADTIAYEILCQITKRVKTVYRTN